VLAELRHTPSAHIDSAAIPAPGDLTLFLPAKGNLNVFAHTSALNTTLAHHHHLLTKAADLDTSYTTTISHSSTPWL